MIVIVVGGGGRSGVFFVGFVRWLANHMGTRFSIMGNYDECGVRSVHGSYSASPLISFNLYIRSCSPEI